MDRGEIDNISLSDLIAHFSSKSIVNFMKLKIFGMYIPNPLIKKGYKRTSSWNVTLFSKGLRPREEVRKLHLGLLLECDPVF